MTETLTYRLLRRNRSDRMVAGVSGGLGRYFDVNPVLYRVGFVVLALLGGAGILIYLAAALVIPDDGQDQSIVDRAVQKNPNDRYQKIALMRDELRGLLHEVAGPAIMTGDGSKRALAPGAGRSATLRWVA